MLHQRRIRLQRIETCKIKRFVARHFRILEIARQLVSLDKTVVERIKFRDRAARCRSQEIVGKHGISRAAHILVGRSRVAPYDRIDSRHRTFREIDAATLLRCHIVGNRVRHQMGACRRAGSRIVDINARAGLCRVCHHIRARHQAARHHVQAAAFHRAAIANHAVAHMSPCRNNCSASARFIASGCHRHRRAVFNIQPVDRRRASRLRIQRLAECQRVVARHFLHRCRCLFHCAQHRLVCRGIAGVVVPIAGRFVVAAHDGHAVRYHKRVALRIVGIGKRIHVVCHIVVFVACYFHRRRLPLLRHASPCGIKHLLQFHGTRRVFRRIGRRVARSGKRHVVHAIAIRLHEIFIIALVSANIDRAIFNPVGKVHVGLRQIGFRIGIVLCLSLVQIVGSFVHARARRRQPIVISRSGICACFKRIHRRPLVIVSCRKLAHQFVLYRATHITVIGRRERIRG